jgi:soluble lytic murein transglycosylase-like protein
MRKLAYILGCVAMLTAAAVADPPAVQALPSAASAMPGMVYVATLRNGFSLRFDHRRIMDETSRLYTTTAEENYIDVPTGEIVSLSQEKLPPPPPSAKAPATEDLKSAVAAASDKHQLDADLIDSVIRAESGFNPRAVSPKGARGLMQLMPETAAKLGVRDAFDAPSNIEGGTRYLRELLRLYNNDLAKALAAYNAGPQRVEQYHGVPPYHETRAYVANVIRDFNRKKLAARKAHAKAAKKAPPKDASAAAKPAGHSVPGS